MKHPTIILDCDPGLDDAFAIWAALEHTELLGVTTVAGNVGVDRTTRNAERILEAAGASVPVHQGAARPLSGETIDAAHVHGETGLGSIASDGPAEPTSTDAISWIAGQSQAASDLWLVATGPLTNVAMALQAHPELASELAGISLLGGAIRGGNRTAAAEFNIAADPEAAEIVFTSGADLIMIGLDVSQKVRLGRKELERLRRADGPRAAMAASLLGDYIRWHEANLDRSDGAVHDPCAVLVLTHPQLFDLQERHVAIETSGRLTRGMTVIDERYRSETPNARVGYGSEAAAVVDLIVAAAL